MIKRFSWIMAFGGGVWGIVLSLTWLIKLNSTHTLLCFCSCYYT